MKILVTGANGMVARAVQKHCASMGDDVAAFTRVEMNIADASDVSDAIEVFGPDAVINCAAFTNVDAAESDAEGAYAANAIGVRNLAAACRNADAAFVTISTDYVFDGTNSGFYTQRDTPNPLGAYGRSKLEGEILARDTYARSIIVRSGWIYGHGGTNFLSVVPQLIAERKGLTAIDDAFGTPTYALDLAVRLRELAVLDLPGIYHVTNAGDGTTYAGFAEAVCDLKGADRGLVKRIANSSLNRPAARPVSSKLACLFSERLGLAPIREWKNALQAFLDSQGASSVSGV